MSIADVIQNFICVFKNDTAWVFEKYVYFFNMRNTRQSLPYGYFITHHQILSPGPHAKRFSFHYHRDGSKPCHMVCQPTHIQRPALGPPAPLSSVMLPLVLHCQPVSVQHTPNHFTYYQPMLYYNCICETILQKGLIGNYA